MIAAGRAVPAATFFGLQGLQRAVCPLGCLLCRVSQLRLICLVTDFLGTRVKAWARGQGPDQYAFG